MNTTKRPLDKISSYYRDNGKLTLSIVISGLIFDGLNCLIPLAEGKAIDAFVGGEGRSAVFFAVGIFLLLALFVQLNRYWKRDAVRKFANRVVISMRQMAFANIMAYPSERLERESRGDLLNKNVADIRDTAEGIRKVTTEIFDSVVLLTGYLISLFIMSPRLTATALPFIALSIAFSATLSKPVYKAVGEYKKKYGEVKQTHLRLVENNTQYVATGASDAYAARYASQLDELEKKAVKSSILEEAMQPLYQIVVLISVITVAVFGGRAVYYGTWSLGQFSAYLTSLLLVASKTGKIGKMFNAYEKAKVCWRRCKPFLSPLEEKKPLVIGDGVLELKNVTFGFNESELKDINYRFEKKIYALSGKVGSGKTTLTELLSGRFAYKGSVALCGVEISELSNYDTHNLIGYAGQTPEIFSGTVEENITLGRKGDIESIAALCGVKGDIALDKALTHRGEKLSGGEKARVCMARALFGAPRLVLLDDTFSGLDVNMSEEIIAGIKREFCDSIVIITTNIPELLSLCDKRLTVEGGRLYERD